MARPRSLGLVAVLVLGIAMSEGGVASEGAPSGFIARGDPDFVNGNVGEFIMWTDDRGEIINAHDGGVIFVDGVYYWYGMALRPLPVGKTDGGGAATTTGITLYSSKDLHDWKFEKVILPCSPDPASPLYGPMRFERPKVLYNAKTKKFVLWFHYVKYPGKHGMDPGYADAGVAVADHITDTFTFLGYHRPIDEQGAVKDCTLFQDTDGTGYFIYDRKLEEGKRSLHIVRLSDDYLSSTDTWAPIVGAEKREAPAMLKLRGRYFLLTSGVSGWKANQAKYFTATDIMGPYTDMGDPCEGPDAASTYESQPTYMLKVEGRPDTWIAMLERHNKENFTHCSYIWLPTVFPTEGTMAIQYHTRWRLEQDEPGAPAASAVRVDGGVSPAPPAEEEAVV